MKENDHSTSCTKFIDSSASIRDEIKKLTIERYGDSQKTNRPFGLYPCKNPSKIIMKLFFRYIYRFRIKRIYDASGKVW